MHISPSPTMIEIVLGFINNLSVDNNDTAKFWASSGQLPYWLSRSAWSLTAIALWRANVGSGTIDFWVPDYFCNQSLAGVRGTGARLHFYPVTPAMTPDWERCVRMAMQTPPHLFLLPHYFGRVNDLEGARSFCQRHCAILIEDCAHVLLPVGSIGTRGDFVIYSPHKLLALPDGALLLARPTVMKRVGRSPEDFATSFGAVLDDFSRGAPATVPWLLRLLFRAVVPARFRTGRSPKPAPGAGAPADRLPFPPRQSTMSRKLIGRQVSRLEALGWQRCENAAVLEALLPEAGPCPLSIVPGEGFPYLYGVTGTEREAAELLARARICECPAITWPDLPPEVLEAPEHHAAAMALQRNTIYFPVHHSVRARTLVARLMGDRPVAPSVPLPDIEILWDVSPQEWGELYRGAPRSHLQQSRGYVAAVSDDSGWCPRYGKILVGGRAVAVLALLEKRGPLGCAAARLNRGPVWLDDGVSADLMVSCLETLSSEYRPKRGRLLFMAPHISMGGWSLAALEAQGWHRRLARPWHSSILDITQSEDHLRRGLDGKWRNQLTAAEGKGLMLEEGEGKDAFVWLLERHCQLMASRGFAGPSHHFLVRLREAVQMAGEPFLVCRALQDGDAVAGIAVVCHGTTATYLIGWNGPEGRAANANNFLLWQAVVMLRRMGYAWFDLGGINEMAEPGIAAFKRGINGREYRLVGEYVNCWWLP